MYAETNAAQTNSVAGVYRTSSGNGGVGLIGEATLGGARGVYGYSASGRGVSGRSDGLGGAAVEGFADANFGAAGVYGVSNKGAGVCGVNTSANGFAMVAQGNATQSRDKGGWVKAMVHLSGSGNIERCYNGLTGASTGNCGFTVFRGFGPEQEIDFGFTVNDRFLTCTGRDSDTIVTCSFSDQTTVRATSLDVDSEFSNYPTVDIIIF